jgi:transposase
VKRSGNITRSTSNDAVYLRGETPQTEDAYRVLLQSLREENQKLTKEIKKLEIEKVILQEKYDLLTYKRFVRSSEQENAAQQSLFDEEPEKTEAETEKPEEKETSTYTRKKNAGRKPIPAEIPREVEVIDLLEEEKRCVCGAELQKIGMDVCEK